MELLSHLRFLMQPQADIATGKYSLSTFLPTTFIHNVFEDGQGPQWI